MSKITWSEERIARLFADGRGQGTGPNYKPFLMVGDFSSRGVSRKVLGHKTGRVHHLFSTVEFQFFLMLEWSADVIDIREQYPIDRELTQAVASEFRLSHPYYPRTHVPTVMTVDFLVTRLRNGNEVLEAYDTKETKELENFRSVEKLEISRSACELMGINHHIIVSEKLPVAEIRNIEWILGASRTTNLDANPDESAQHTARLFAYLSNQSKERTLLQCCGDYDIACGLPAGSALRYARVLMHHRALRPDLAIEDLPNTPLARFEITATPGQPLAVGG